MIYNNYLVDFHLIMIHIDHYYTNKIVLYDINIKFNGPFFMLYKTNCFNYLILEIVKKKDATKYVLYFSIKIYLQ